ncbi:MAG: ArsR family transcriptional regulator [Bacteroidota bacterium]|jgi:two-component system alkaline phosphatase synthesis response regulator PhoP|nr:ArsR family transcriptional regulator [Bacteroidota bacterium]
MKKTKEYLEEKKYHLTIVASEEHLHQMLKAGHVNLVIIELDYAPKDGITLTSDIRNLKEIEQPYIIIFSNKQDDYIQITAFNSGADDFIISPIKPILLEARIATLKKRLLNKTEEISEADKHPNFFVDKEQYLIITKTGKISLPRKEFEMINLMYQNTHKIFTRQDFAKLIWNAPEVANSRTIDIHIRNIRRSLGNDIIKTTKGVGYTINKDLL